MNTKKIIAIVLTVAGVISLICAVVIAGHVTPELSNIVRLVFAVHAVVCAVVSAVFWVLGNK